MDSPSVKLIAAFLVCAAGLVGCGDDSTSGPEATEAMGGSNGVRAVPEPGDGNAREGDRGSGTEIVTGSSEFGEMLYDAGDQAIYVFENDPEGESACYGECAEAWPPVLTEGEPRAGQGVDTELLGTTERRDGSQQVTYAGRPLYFYAHENPGEVRCHNVDLNGGLWWVVGPDGEPRAA